MEYNLKNNLSVVKNQLQVNGNPDKEYVIVLKNDSSDSKCSLAWKVDDNNKLLPLKTLNKLKFTNLYCTFPLLGSEGFSFPIVLHSAKFKPNEKRNGILLDNENEGNRLIIESAISLFKNFMMNYSQNFSGIFNIIEISDDKNLDRIDKSWHSDKISELRKSILTTKIISTYKIDGSIERQSIINESGNTQVFFPQYQTNRIEETKELNSTFYDLCSPLFGEQLPIKSELNDWLKNLWHSNEIKRININDLLNRLLDYSNLDELKSGFHFGMDVKEEDKEIKIINWLKKLYAFITKIKRAELLNFSNNNKTSGGIILTRGNKFKKLSDCKLDVGHDNNIIDEKLLLIHNNICGGNRINDLIKEDFELLNSETKSQLTESSLASEIKSKIEDELIGEHDKLSNKKSNDEEFTNEDSEKMLTIQNKLSELQIWISEKNDERKYFNDFFKRKLLQAIIDEKKSVSLMRLIELDRSNKVSLEKQSQILQDEDLDEKLRLGEIFLKIIREKADKDEKNRAIGKHFENLFKELLENENIEFIKKDGEQDFILFPNTNSELFIELKSIISTTNSILLTPEQSDKLIKEKENYFLCVIPHSGDIENNDSQKIKKDSRFTNSLHNLLAKKIDQLDTFKVEENGIKGTLPIEEVLSQINEKEFKISIKKDKWSIFGWHEFMDKVKANRQQIHNVHIT